MQIRDVVTAAIIGKTVINSIAAGQTLGHATVAGQLHYTKINSPQQKVVAAYGRGRLDEAAEALEEFTGRTIGEITRDVQREAFAPLSSVLEGALGTPEGYEPPRTFMEVLASMIPETDAA